MISDPAPAEPLTVVDVPMVNITESFEPNDNAQNGETELLDTILDYGSQPIRVMGTAEEPLFVAKDVCRILGLEHTGSALRGIDDEDLVVIKSTSGGQRRDMQSVTESGLYHLIFKSRKKEARRFKRWVTKEVLPSIRKQGYYRVPEMSRREQLERELMQEYKVDTLEELHEIIRPQNQFGELSPSTGKPKTKLVRSHWRTGKTDERSERAAQLELQLNIVLKLPEGCTLAQKPEVS